MVCHIYKNLHWPEIKACLKEGKTVSNRPGLIKTKAGKVIEIDNCRVVSYSAFLSLKYDCHIHLEYVYDKKCCRYVLKYLMKECDMAYVRVQKKTKRSEKM